MASEKVAHLTLENFDTTISTGITLVDFWAEWCRPCKMLAPIIDQLADDFDGKIKVAKVDVDAQNDLASRFGIVSIPTLLLFKDGQPIDKTAGVAPKAAFEAMINKHL